MKILALFFILIFVFNTSCFDEKGQLPDQTRNNPPPTDNDDDPEESTFPFPSWMGTIVNSDSFIDANPSQWLTTPNFLDYRNDPDTNKKIWRLAGDTSEMQAKLPHPTSSWTEIQSQHFYSRNSPSNNDESFAFGSTANNLETAALWKLKPTIDLVAVIPAGTTGMKTVGQRQLLWDKTHNNVYWFCEDNKLFKATIDFSNNYSTQVELWETFSGYDSISFGEGEGDFSDDGNRLVLSAFQPNKVYLVPYKINSKEITSHLLVIDSVSDIFDWASVDPSGDYVIFSIMKNSVEYTARIPFTSVDFSSEIQLINDRKHSDLILDKNNQSWIVYADWRGVFASRTSDGFIKKIWPKYEEFTSIGEPTVENPPHKTMSGHVSRVSDYPGVVLLFRYQDGGMYFLNIDYPEHTIYAGNAHLGDKAPTGKNTKSLAQPWGITDAGEPTWYFREPRASASRSGKNIFFVSDYRVWGDQEGDYDPEPALKAFLNMLVIWDDNP